MTPSSRDVIDEIAEFIAEFCKRERVGPDRDVSALKRELWGRIGKRWPDAGFTVVNRALAIAYEIIIAKPNHKQALAVIEAFRGDH
jgi:hypothetical protein